MTVFKCGLYLTSKCKRYSRTPLRTIEIGELESRETYGRPTGYWRYEKVATCPECIDALMRATGDQ